MRNFRRWLAWRLLELARRIHPSPTWNQNGGVWQIIEVPRRISENRKSKRSPRL